jgi:MoxR-like ATPase
MEGNDREIFAKLLSQIDTVVVDGRQPALLLLCSLLARGHVLIEDVPGVGKTLLARSLARCLGLGFGRVQCTPDVLPGDILGFSLYDVQTGQATFRPGAVMNQLLLVDEINRASPKTQSCLLEVMEERQSTVDGVTRPLPEPFMVIATQNPIESVGTSPLPEAQLDRFLMRISLGYPDAAAEADLLLRFRDDDPLSRLSAMLDGGELLELQRRVAAVQVARPVAEYITDLCRRTRAHERVALGVSPRGALALMRAAQAMALIGGQDFITPDQVRALAKPVLAHRLILHGASQGRSDLWQDKVIDEVLAQAPVPLK